MDSDTSKQSESFATNTTRDLLTAPTQAARVFPPFNNVTATVSRPSSSAATFQISSDYYREVTRTTDIAGRLPNAVYTLPPHIVQAIVGRATIRTKRRLFAVCKKFCLADGQYVESKEVFVDGERGMITRISLDCGRLYSEGYNFLGQCGIGSKEFEVIGPRLIRLPPVLEVWCGHGRWFALTTRGLYAWGTNKSGPMMGMLGLGDDECVRQPRRVPIDNEVLDVYQTSHQSFFRTTSGWLGCGWNVYGQLGLGHTDDNVTTPTPIPGSEGVTRWAGDGDVSLAFTDGGMLACGGNFGCQCGVGSTAEIITALTPVALPDDVKGRVDRVLICSNSTFFISGRRCFGCGHNEWAELGIDSEEDAIPTPVELPITVDDIISNEGVTIIRSGDTLLACGDNQCRYIASNDTPTVATPTPLDLPGPVKKIGITKNNTFAQLTDGAWVGRGIYVKNDFIPVPRADLIDGPDADLLGRTVRLRLLPGWTPVIDNYAEKLNVWESDDVMFIPEPIANA